MLKRRLKVYHPCLKNSSSTAPKILLCFSHEIVIATPMNSPTLETPPVAERFCAQTGRQEMPGSYPGCTCLPNRLEFSMVFSETHVNTG